MFGLSKTRTSPRVAELTEKRLAFWKDRYDYRIIEIYEDMEFLEIVTRNSLWRVYGTDKSNFYIVEK